MSRETAPGRYYPPMPTWDANQYLRFNDERTRPCRELAARVEVGDVRRVIDLGCGPGNSTEVLAERWAGAEIVGLDSSVAMIEAAKKSNPTGDWRVGGISEWAENSEAGRGGDHDGGAFDVVFSNAAMQWVADHARVFAKLMGRVRAGGAMAVQMPGNFGAAAHSIMREIASAGKWKAKFPAGGVREWHVHEAADYYDWVSPFAARVDIWETEYHQVMADAGAIVEWYKGTGLRPFLDGWGEEGLKKEFLGEYGEKIAAAYPGRKDGKVIFPFRRILSSHTPSGGRCASGVVELGNHFENRGTFKQHAHLASPLPTEHPHLNRRVRVGFKLAGRWHVR